MAAKRIFSYFCVLGLLLALSPLLMYGQMAGTGFVSGTVTDPSGAAVVGASVTMTDTATNAERTSTTNDTGRYIFANVTPGKYNIVIVKAGFRQVRFSDQEVVVGESRTFDAKMEIGVATETVEVVATNTELQTMNATIGTTVTGVALSSLPTLGRDVSTFVGLQAGVTPEGSVAGAVYDQNSFQLDGGNNSNDMDGSNNVYTPSAAGDPTGGLTNYNFTGTGGGGPTGVMPTPVDSIEEFKVGTTNQTADFNSSAGAQVSMVTKRGTNQWHGTGYEYYLDNGLNANSWTNNASGTPLPSYHYNRFGAAGGGPVIPKEILGGRWYFFGNYEGFRWNNSATELRAVPSEAMKQGILQFQGQAYNINPTAVTYNGPATPILTPGQVVQPAVCPGPSGTGVPCDPRGLGISPVVQQMFQKYEPPSNVPVTFSSTGAVTSGCLGLSRCDGLNVLAFQANALFPYTDNFGVARLDHDFGAKWHFYATYHYYKLVRAVNNQIDIGGFFSGDKLGVPASVAARPQDPWYLTGGLTTNVTTNVTNDFHYNYLRNYWAWTTNAQPPQIAGLNGALEPNGESATNVLSPYNVNTQNVRTRFWDGHNNMVRDDVSWTKGTHFLQFGGTYQRNYDWHQRTDNGGGINYNPVFQMGLPGYLNTAGYVPTGVTSSNWGRDYGIVLGIPSIDQVAYTRTGTNLQLNPPNTPAFDQSTIPFYNLYFSDSWRVKPTFTLTYGLGWTLEMPPTEKNGKQVAVVGPDGKQLDTETYLNDRKQAALQGQVYNPDLGFALLANVVGHPKYLYNPFYKEFSPRVAAAWNPSFDSGLLGDVFGRNKTVVRGGYSILYGRLNGVDLVLVPLLGTGLIQATQCNSPLMDGSCAGSVGSTPSNAFRIGPDGLKAPLLQPSATLPQPDYPGINAIAAGAGEGLDSNFRPNMSQQWDLTIQRQINPKVTLEFGYIGRKITHEYQPVNINAVPYMLTINGQSFAKAYGQMVWQYCGGAQGLAGGNCGGPGGNVVNPNLLTPQPFFEKAMNPAYCVGFTSCTAAVASNEGQGKTGNGNIGLNAVWSLYSDLDNGGFNTSIIPRSMLNTPIPGSPYGANGQLTSGIGMNASIGYSNYNGGFIQIKTSDWHGLTMQSNFTMSKAMGTGANVQATSEFTVPDPYNLGSAYGLQNWDRKFVWNTWIVYQVPFFKKQHGFLGRIAGGWSIAPILTLGSGLPDYVNPTDNNIGFLYGGAQSFGAADGASFGAYQNAINMCGQFGNSRVNNPVPNTLGLGTNGFGPEMFHDPAAVYNCFRNPILGIDGSSGGGYGTIRGQMFWNVDLSLIKNIMITERVSSEFTFNVYNVFNHPQFGDSFNLLGDQADFGALEAQANNPRSMQFGLRIRF